MSVGKVIYNILSNDSDVTAIVGSKIYPYLSIEDIVYPYLVYDQSQNDPTDTKDGKSCLDITEYNITMFCETISELNDLGNKVRNALDRTSGTYAGVVIQSIKYNDEDNGYADGDRVYGKVQSYSFRYETIYASLLAPTVLTATGVSTSQIDLAWNDNATGETGYEIWRSTDLVTFVLIDTIAADSISYSDTGLSSDNAFAYKVRAINTDGGGQWSNIALGVTTSDADSFILSEWNGDNCNGLVFTNSGPAMLNEFIEDGVDLTTNSPVRTFDVSGINNIRHSTAVLNTVTGIDFGSNDFITLFNCINATKIVSYIVRDCSLLTSLSINPSAPNSTAITTLDISGNYLLESLDLSNLINVSGSLVLDNNRAMTSLVFPTASGGIQSIDLTNSFLLEGVLDISGLTISDGGTLSLTSSDVTNITFPTSSNELALNLSFNDLTGTLDLSTMTGLTGQLNLSVNSNLTSVTWPANTIATSIFKISSTALSGDLDFSFLNFAASGSIEMTNLGLLSSVIFPTTSSDITFLNLNSTQVTAGYEFSNMTNLSTRIRAVSTNAPVFTFTGNSNTFIDIQFNNLNSLDEGDFFQKFTNACEVDNGVYQISGASLPAADVNRILVDIDNNTTGGFTGRSIFIGGATNDAPDATSGGFDGLAAKASLITKLFSVNTN